LVHTHGIPDVTGLQTALDGKAPLSHDHNATYNGVSRTVQLTIDEIDNTKSDVGHTHVKANITDFAHTHGIPDITNLQTTLDGKAPTSHNHLKADITDFAHTHVEADITDLQDYALSNHDHNLIYNGVSRGLQATVDEIDATKSDIDHTHPGFENNFPPPRVLVVSNAAGAPSSYYSTIQAALNAAYNNGTHTANLVMVFDSGTAYNEKIVLKDQVDVMFMGEATLHPTTDTTTSPVIDANNVTCQIYGLNVEINHSAVCLNVAGSSNLKVFGAGYLTATNCITVKDSAKLNYEGIEINGTSAFMSSGLVQITCDQAGNLLVQAGTVEIDTKECGDIVVSGSGHLDMEFDYALNHSILVNEGARFDLKGGLWEVTGDNGVIPVHNDGTFRADCVKFKRDFTECIRIDSTTAVTILAHCTLYSASNLYTVTQALSGCSLTNLGSYFNKTVQVTTINVDTAIVDINVII
jgi:hypothetical protein